MARVLTCDEEAPLHVGLLCRQPPDVFLHMLQGALRIVQLSIPVSQQLNICLHRASLREAGAPHCKHSCRNLHT